MDHIAVITDETTFYDFQSDVFQLEINLQRALNLLHIWCQQNSIVLNTDKTKVMLITSRQERLTLQNPGLSLRYSDIDIKMTPSEKILGVHVDYNLMWNNHFQHVSKKNLIIFMVTKQNKIIFVSRAPSHVLQCLY